MDLDNIDSDEFIEDEEEERDPNGFIFSHNLDTYKRSKRQRLAEVRGEFDREEHRDKFKRKRDKKKGGKSNREKEINKPFMMVRGKKMHEMREKFESVKKKINHLK